MRKEPGDMNLINADWISILKCPLSGQNLRVLSPADLADINNRISSNQVYTYTGHAVQGAIEAGLVSEDKEYLYPIINGIVILLKEEALVQSADKVISSESNSDKQLVQDFYNQKGWLVNNEGSYEDAVIYEDLRDVSKEYIRKCHNRVSRFLNPSGTYMLDAASGALQFSDYLQYSANYKIRVCVDFSFMALSEAQKKLGDKGIYILADMTNMPFKDSVMDGFVSLNTVYHIPKDEQVQAIKELYRVLAKDGKGIVVYDWFKHSLWMNVSLLPFRALEFIKNRILKYSSKLLGKNEPPKRLYFYAHAQSYFKEHLPPYELAVWRSISVPFMRYYIHSWLGGKKILEKIYEREEKYPELYGLRGEYPMFIFKK